MTRWDGNVGAVRHLVPSPATGDSVSPTRLQAWAECPFRYLLANVLKVRVEDTPERLLELSALDRGTLVHEVLERFVREELDRPPETRTPAGAPWPPTAMGRVVEIMGECAADAEARGLTGKATLWALHREDIAADLVEFVVRDSERRVRDGSCRSRWSCPSGSTARRRCRCPWPTGGRVAFRGRADRVDVRPDGTRVVVDYKTGKAYRTPKPGEDPLEGGARLQLPVYAAAARQLLGAPEVEAAYWFVSAAGWLQPTTGSPSTPTTEARFREVVGQHRRRHRRGLVPGRARRAEHVLRDRASTAATATTTRCVRWIADAQYELKARRAGARGGLRVASDTEEDATDDRARWSTTAARRRITTEGLDELLFVEAGAGTGKTKQLVDRVVALVLDRGVPMREIAAITFTEAAASELRARIREAFERLVHDEAVGRDERRRTPRRPWWTSTAPRSGPCTASPSACSPSIRSRPGCHRTSRCWTRWRACSRSDDGGRPTSTGCSRIPPSTR